MAGYRQVYSVIHFTSPAGWSPVHRDQFQTQRSVTLTLTVGLQNASPAVWSGLSLRLLIMPPLHVAIPQLPLLLQLLTWLESYGTTTITRDVVTVNSVTFTSVSKEVWRVRCPFSHKSVSFFATATYVPNVKYLQVTLYSLYGWLHLLPTTFWTR